MFYKIVENVLKGGNILVIRCIFRLSRTRWQRQQINEYRITLHIHRMSDVHQYVQWVGQSQHQL